MPIRTVNIILYKWGHQGSDHFVNIFSVLINILSSHQIVVSVVLSSHQMILSCIKLFLPRITCASSVLAATCIAESISASASQFVATVASFDPEQALGALLVLVLLSERDELVISFQMRVVDLFGRDDWDSFVLSEDAFDPVFLRDELIFLCSDCSILVAGVVSMERLTAC